MNRLSDAALPEAGAENPRATPKRSSAPQSEALASAGRAWRNDADVPLLAAWREIYVVDVVVSNINGATPILSKCCCAVDGRSPWPKRKGWSVRDDHDANWQLKRDSKHNELVSVL